jgi:predicted nuclease of predicted toxin-antitoxin system
MGSEIDDHEWHEFPWDDAPSMPPGPHKKLKLLADANIPKPMIDELRSAGIVVHSAVEKGIATHPDRNILQLAKKLGAVLLTMDKDFWEDRQYPLQKSPGVIFIDIPPDQVSKAIDGLAKFYALFAQGFPLDWWDQMKAKVSENAFRIKNITWEGRTSEDEYRLLEDGKLQTRTIR